MYKQASREARRLLADVAWPEKARRAVDDGRLAAGRVEKENGKLNEPHPILFTHGDFRNAQIRSSYILLCIENLSTGFGLLRFFDADRTTANGCLVEWWEEREGDIQSFLCRCADVIHALESQTLHYLFSFPAPSSNLTTLARHFTASESMSLARGQNCACFNFMLRGQQPTCGTNELTSGVRDPLLARRTGKLKEKNLGCGG
ncbi:hypothetical protein E2C01_019075 [Portunus trituberculatus]|uniref:Uncharacterized protein n=1 Tax=Portunus trituberculatus TaxID=210409 RepID=A0A5B7DWB9_PORTR|nr:hypothetical protein [Portunus trituberculatus]